jgi:nucleoside-diphosphate-sugar epimerase
MRILVTGGTGFVGRRLAEALLASGHAVRVLGRNEAACRDLAAAGAEVVRGDLRDAAAVTAACHGCAAVYHVGALSAPWGRSADFHAVNGVARLVYVSSPSVTFDGRDQVNATEAVPYPARFLSVYSLTKKLGEDLVNAAHSGGLATVIVRPKAVFGPGDTTLLPRLVAAARRGRLPQIGDGHNRVDLTYVDNVVHALALCLDCPAAVGKTYTITNGESVRLWEVVATVLRRLGVAARLRPLPLGLVSALAAGLELRARLLGGEPVLTRYTVAILGRTQTYDITAARRDLGYEPPVPVAEGIERTLAAWPTGGTHA